MCENTRRERPNTRRTPALFVRSRRFLARCVTSKLLGLAGLVVAFLAIATPAWAIDHKKTAVALAQQAAKAFEAGDMDRAAQAYLEAWHTDASEPNYLYGAARAEQSAGQRDRAEEHYRQFVAIDGVDPARVAKAKGYLTEFEGVRSDEKVQAADRAAKREDWRVAAAAYGEAWQLRQDRLPLLLKAARAANESGDHAKAESWLNQYLTRAPEDAPDRAEAQAMLDALQHKTESSPTQVPTDHNGVHEPGRPSLKRTAGWWTLGTGAAIAATGAVLVVLGKSAESQLNQDLGYDGTVVHGAVTWDQAQTRGQSIGTLQTAGVTLLGVGAAAIGVGAVMVWLSNDAKVSVVPDWHGFALAGRF
jgi:thioredoxin-like negative regulator of GroEL